MKLLKVIIIDPILQTIKTDLIEDSLEGLQYAIGYRNIEIVYFDEKEKDIMYADEEGLYRENQGFFVISCSNRKIPIAGKAVVLGNDLEYGKNKDVNSIPTDLSKIISFHNIIEMSELSKKGYF